MSQTVTTRPFVQLVPVYGAVSAFVIGIASIQVFPSVFGDTFGLNFIVFEFLLLGAFAAGGLYLAWRASRPGLVLLSLPFVVWGAIDLGLGCIAEGCSIPSGYTSHLHLLVHWPVFIGLPLGPAVVITTEPLPCVTGCTYSIELVPLGIGYVILGAGIRALG